MTLIDNAGNVALHLDVIRTFLSAKMKELYSQNEPHLQ